MDKKASDIVTLIRRMRRRYKSKRRFKNYSIISGLVFELFRTIFPMKQAMDYVDFIEKHYVDWNEFRLTPIQTIQKDLALETDDLTFVAQCKKILANIFSELSSFSLAYFSGQSGEECLELLKRAGVDSEIAAVVLLTYADKPVLPLPDGILRFIKRMGIFPNKSSRSRVRNFFFKLGDEGIIDVYQTYRLFLEHTEKICFLKSPGCSGCFVSKECKESKK